MKVEYLDEPFFPKGSGLPRSGGLHVSDVLWDIMVTLNRNPGKE